MRLIDADWVLAALGVFNDRKHGDAHFFNGIASAEEIVEHAPTIATRDWTPCAEGLPEDGQEVLFDVICDMNIGDLYGVYKGKYDDGVFWIDEHDHKSYIGAPKETVTEWMPCPKAHRTDDTTGKVKEEAE